ncbi:intraflagellar transport protein 172 homolog [Ostrinia nubilalis]|uniref:intraflagellar transport protein 172 homolog n=1 Tax=Ostrinia nubilalis TaxID=29057 RepID=UPI0030822F81
MRLKYSKTLLEAQENESPIADITWSPNNVKLAVATCERVVLLFDREGVRRDKFSTKPADPQAGKKSYVITGITFSDNSELLGVAQSDSMVFVYRVGADWSGKKVICNKFPLTAAPMKLLPADNGFFTGTADGKISDTSELLGVAQSDNMVFVYRLIVGACDGRVSVYEAQRGALVRSVEPALPPDARDLVCAAPSPSGQTVAFGVFDGCLVGELKESGGLELATLQMPHLHAARALAWSGDGTKLAVASQAGAVIQLEAVLRRWIPWAGGGERVYAAVGGACLLHRAGELSVVEYGLDRVLHTVRTERVNPHVLSVRINEGGDTRKHLAYLLDRQTIAVVDLTTGVQLGQWWHEARVDWLELNETGQLLLLRDTRRRLALLRLETGDKEIIASGVGFVQWIENCDAVVAQTPTHLLIWYSVWEADSAEMAECSGGVAVEVNARRVLFEGGQVPYLQLDEHRLAFNNALRSGDLAGCAKYLDGVGNNADVASLWRQLAERALATDDIQLAAKCYREVGDEARMFYLDKTVELAASVGDGDVAAGLNVATVRARLSIFAGDLPSAEEWYVKKAGKPELAIDMYKQFDRWAEAVALAEKTDRAAVAMLKQQHMDYLTSTGRLGEAGAALASSGDVQGAVRLWLRGGRARRAAALLLQHASLLRDTELVDAVHTQLVQEEWWEMAGEISERRGDSRTAVEYYAKGNNFARAVQLAREACPAEVTSLEGMWGSWLVSSRQAGAAVPHLIEAGDTRGALAAALKAHHYRKALQIVQVIEDKESIREQCEQLGDHFISTQEWETAERVLSSCGMAERCVRAYNTAGRVADGLRLAAQHLTEEETRDIYLPLAQQMREDGQLRKAEQIYIGLGEPDEAISMYKEASQYEAMLRLVAAHRSSLLEATRRHVAQALHASGDLRAAENYYIQAGDWKAAIQMYRSAGQWEGAERVARAHAPSSVQQQVALQWAGALGGAPAARLLAARGLAALGARWALQAQRWDIALELSELGGGVTKREVARHEAAALADEQPEAAEAAFLRAAAPDDAVRMWLARGQHQRALVLAEQHASHMVEEVLVEGARAAAERGDLAQFETLMIRANRPREVVQHYKDLELWDEASRVSREYLPDGGEPVPSSVPPLLQRAADHADRGEWWEAVELLISASAAGANDTEGAALERLARAGHWQRCLAHAGPRAPHYALRYAVHLFKAHPVNTEGAALERLARAGHWQRCLAHAGPRAPHYALRYAVHLFKAHPMSIGGGAAIERLARAGHWQRCLAHAGPRAPHYALRYAVHLFKAHPRMEGIDIESEDIPEALSQVLEVLRQYLVGDAGPDTVVSSADTALARGVGGELLRMEGIDIESEDVPEALSQVLEVLRQYLVGDAGPDTVVSSADTALARGVCGELLARASCAPRALRALQDTANVLRAAGADDRAMQAITLLLALHVAQVAGRAARALPRYSNIVVADVAYYASGVAIRAEGSGGSREAFVLLNRCLDLAEAADEDSAHMLDYTDFECTDWSRTPLLLESACVRGAPLDDIREWVLAVSMDQAVEQTLPVDSRGQYGAALGAGEACCVLTGYPLGSRLVTFTNGRCANREWWSRCAAAARGGGAAQALVSHITDWCGPADFAQL